MACVAMRAEQDFVRPSRLSRKNIARLILLPESEVPAVKSGHNQFRVTA
jgi:hypothetical protein